jgi:bifunctional UDP-N-acetylglucosamine pyrophosphorylase / glucosamine-1-phosphate N-acetyltransferase
MPTRIAAVIMAGGLGTRMRSQVPKHLHPLLGKRLVDWVIEAARELGPDRLVVVTSPGSASAYDDSIEVAVQPEPRGTGDAVATARRALDGFDGGVLVVPGDAPLVTAEMLQQLVEAHRRDGADVTLLSFSSPAALPYGRIVRDANGDVARIVEERDATAEERAIEELNASYYVFDAAALWGALEQLDSDNAQGELYLTDAVAHVVSGGGRVAAHRAQSDPRSLVGVNTRAELAQAAAELRDRINERHMLAGVTIVDPQTTWIDAEVELEADSTVHPFTVLRGATRVAAGAEIGPHAAVLDAEIGPGALAGPFCYLRPGTVLAAGAKAGAFVEIKNTRVGERSKVPHLSYIGDADIGEDSNIGAGAITANFPHEPDRPKQRTKIGKNVRTAVHNAFIAPVEIGDDAWTAAGSVITDDVPPGSLAGFPPRQVTKEGYVRARRDDGE